MSSEPPQAAPVRSRPPSSERTSFIVGITVSGVIIALMCFFDLIQAGLSQIGSDVPTSGLHLRESAAWGAWPSAIGWVVMLILGLIFKSRRWGWLFGVAAIGVLVTAHILAWNRFPAPY